MLRIRHDQLRAFAAEARQGFEDRAVDHLRRVLPERFAEIGEAGLRRMVREGVDRGRSYGMVTERDLTLLVDLMVGCDGGIDAAGMAWARRILADKTVFPKARLDAVYAELPGRSRAASPQPPGAGAGGPA